MMKAVSCTMRGLVAFVLTWGLSPVPQAFAQVYAYPGAGQNEQQQQQDHFECHQWSVDRTGVNPNRPPPSYQSYGYSSAPQQGGYFGKGQTGEGGMVRDAAGGAALGAIGGAIAGNAGKGAAIGALAGTLFGGIRRSSRNEQQSQWEQQQQMEAQRQQQEAQIAYERQLRSYYQAYAACMTSRDYNVQ